MEQMLTDESGYQPDHRGLAVLKRRGSTGMFMGVAEGFTGHQCCVCAFTIAVHTVATLLLNLPNSDCKYQTEIFVFKQISAAVVAAGCLYSASAQAHFQMVYTPELLRERGGSITLKAPFTHPADNGHVMTIDAPEAFYQLRKGKKTDLLPSVKKIDWTSAENTGPAFEVDARLKGLGDNIFVYRSAPYFEESEDIYIQQITKTIVNVGSLPSGWEEDLGLDAEIVPLTKPYAIYEGGTFTGVVKSQGQPVPFAEIEVEYVNYLPDLSKNAFSADAQIEPPADAFVTMTIFADANGTFTFGMPKAGQWGFCALGVGPKTEHNGKEMSQDAVIWVQAHPVK